MPKPLKQGRIGTVRRFTEWCRAVGGRPFHRGTLCEMAKDGLLDPRDADFADTGNKAQLRQHLFRVGQQIRQGGRLPELAAKQAGAQAQGCPVRLKDLG
ncbi:hypothetical protein [Roseicyclus sp.]